MKFHRRWAVTVLSVVALSASSLADAASVSGQGTWETTLQGRDLDGYSTTAEAWYDTALNITWLADANYAKTSGYDADGLMDFTTAKLWARGLNINGITGWRLPTTIDADGPDADSLGNDGCDMTPTSYQGLDCGYNISVLSEMAHMFYVTLGNKAYASTSGTFPQPGWGLTNTANFANVQANYYWSVTEYAPGTSNAWEFTFMIGSQLYQAKPNRFYAWAVRSGDVGTAVSSVPVPAAAWLFGSGLIGLLGFARCRKK